MAILDYRVELRDPGGALQYLFSKPVSLSWEYLRKGGCESASVEVVSPFESLAPSAVRQYDLQILLDTGSGLTVWWRGLVMGGGRKLGELDILQLSALGYGRRLDRIPVVGLGFGDENGAVVFTSDIYPDAALMAGAMVDRVKPWVAVTYDAISVPNSGISPERKEYTGSIWAALKDLAETAGNLEWGIDANLKFHFRAASSAVTYVTIPGKDIQQFELQEDISSMVNRLYIIGARSGSYRAVIELTGANLVVDQSQMGSAESEAFGKSTTNQRLLQTFASVKGTVSQVELKVAKTGFGANLILTDADMELTTTTDWTKLWSSTTLGKDTNNPHGGSRSLKVTHASGAAKYGFYRNITVVAGQPIFWSLWARTQAEIVNIELVDGSGAWGSGAAVLDSTASDASLWSYRSLTSNTNPTGTTAGLRIWVTNNRAGLDPFWVDDMMLTQDNGGDVRVSIVERLTAGPPPTFGAPIAATTIPFASVPNSPTFGTFAKQLTTYLDTAKTYGIMVEAQGALSDTKYFLLAKSAAGGYTGGALFIYNGTSWISATGDAYFKTLLPQSQIDNGLWGEVVRNPAISGDNDAQLWGNAFLARRGGPVSRARLVLANWDQQIEANIPIGLIRVVGLMDTGLQVERIRYALSDNGLTTDMELGEKLPAIADFLEWLEAQLVLRDT